MGVGGNKCTLREKKISPIIKKNRIAFKMNGLDDIQTIANELQTFVAYIG